MVFFNLSYFRWVDELSPNMSTELSSTTELSYTQGIKKVCGKQKYEKKFQNQCGERKIRNLMAKLEFQILQVSGL